MADFHIFLGEKGGTGKTFFACVLAHYLQARFKDIRCIDTEKGGTGLASFLPLAAHLIREESAQETAHELVKSVLSLDAQDLTFIIDTPSELFASFIEQNTQTPLNSLLKAAGCTLTLHTVVTSGLPAEATLRGLKELSEAFPETPLAVWCNPFFGIIKYETSDVQNSGQIQTFDERLVAEGFVQHDQLRGFIKVPYFRAREDGNLCDALIVRMLGYRQSFTEAMHDKDRFDVFQQCYLQFLRNEFLRAVHHGLFSNEPLPECLLKKIPAPEDAITELLAEVGEGA